MTVHKSVRTKPGHCLACGKEVTGASAYEVNATPERYIKPTPGDVTICINCGHIMQFDKKLKLKNLNPRRHKAVSHDPRILALLWGIKEMNKELFGKKVN